MALLSQAEFARQQGYSKQYVNKLVKQGKIQLINGKVDVENALAAIQQQADPARADVLPSSPSTNSAPTRNHQADYQKARALKETVKAQLTKLEYDKETGKVVSRAEVQDAWFRAGRMLRDQLLQLPDRIDARLADILNLDEEALKKCNRVLKDEIHKVLEELSNDYA